MKQIEDLENYSRGIEILNNSISNLQKEDFGLKPIADKWSIAELIIHLVDADIVMSDRMKRIIAEDRPLLMAFNQDKWREKLFYVPEAVESSLLLFTANRLSTLFILDRLSEDDFKRTGIHSEAGLITLSDTLKKAISHFDHHMKFLYEKRDALGKGIKPVYSKE